MKKTLKLLFGVGLTISAFFLYTKTAEAIQQPIYDTGSGALTGAQMFAARQTFITPPDGINTTTINNITLYVSSNNNCYYKLSVMDTNSTLHNSTNTLVSAVAGPVTFNFESNPPTTANVLYWTLNGSSIDKGDGCWGATSNYNGVIYGSNSTSTYPNGYASFAGNLNTGNEFFLINTTTAQTTISFTNTASSTNDFDNWLLSVYNATGIDHTSDWQMVVKYGTADQENLLLYSDLSANTGPNADNSPGTYYPIKKKTPLLPGFTFYARAYLYSTTDKNYFDSAHLIASSTVLEFIITAGGKVELFGQPPSTTAFDYLGNPYADNNSVTSTGNIYTCNPSDPLFTRSLCKMFVFLFVPSPETFTRFTELKASLQNKPPFGYVTVYTNALNGLGSATSTSSTTDLSQLSQLSFIQTFKTILAWIVYIMFGFWAFNRFRHFSLHG